MKSYLEERKTDKIEIIGQYGCKNKKVEFKPSHSLLAIYSLFRFTTKPVYREKGTLPKKGRGSSFNVPKVPPLFNLRTWTLMSSPLSLTLKSSTQDHHLPFYLFPLNPLK